MGSSRQCMIPAFIALFLISPACTRPSGDKGEKTDECPTCQECPPARECPQRPVSAPVPEQPIQDTPNQHNMFIIGDKTLFVEHMPMFTMEDHMYQMVLEITLPDDVTEAYRKLRREHPEKVPNLVNTNIDRLILPAVASGDITQMSVDVFADYNGETVEPLEQMFSGVPMQIRRVVTLRHFDYSFDYPGELTYLLFGRDSEAHLTRYISRDPDYQHLLTLPAPPAWISQEQLRAGVQVNFVGLPGNEVPCAQPLTRTSYEVRFQGWEKPTQTLELGTGATRWFSTANDLNAKDPCAKAGSAP